MKIIVDILMFIILILEFSKAYLSNFVHEVLGILLVALIIIHLILNRNYIKVIFKGKYNLSRIIMLVVNALFFISMITTIILGICISQSLFTNISTFNSQISKLHIILSSASLIILGLHLGINLKTILAKMKIFKNKYVSIIVGLLMSGYGIYSIFNVEFLNHIRGQVVFASYDSNVLIGFLGYASIVLFISIITHNIYKYCK